MHYKNGREAKNGDKVMVFPGYGPAYVGIMYDSVAGNDHCNGKVAVCSPSDPMVNLQEALHIDDVKAAVGDLAAVADTSKPAEAPAA